MSTRPHKHRKWTYFGDGVTNPEWRMCTCMRVEVLGKDGVYRSDGGKLRRALKKILK